LLDYDRNLVIDIYSIVYVQVQPSYLILKLAIILLQNNH
jgi:hypothetical protein